MRTIQELPIDQIEIINPRERDPSLFSENISSIERIGLKRPIVVNERYLAETGKYELVCGQGRLEALRKIGETTIPSLMVDVDRPTALIMSIAENTARQTPSPLWFAKVVKGLYDGGMTAAEIGEVIGKSPEAVSGYLTLICDGEEILLEAMEQDRVSATVAIDIARAQDPEHQKLLLEGYQKGEFNTRETSTIRKLLDLRNRFGKAREPLSKVRRTSQPIKTLEDLREEIKKTLGRQEEFVQKSQRAENRLVIMAEGYRRLQSNPIWIDLIDNEELTAFPKLKGDFFSGIFES